MPPFYFRMRCFSLPTKETKHTDQVPGLCNWYLLLLQNRVEVALTSVGFALEQWADALFWLSHVTNQLQMKQLRYICALFWFFHALPLESKTLIVRKSNRRYMSEKSVKFLRLVEVQRRVPFSRSTIYLKISRGEFPPTNQSWSPWPGSNPTLTNGLQLVSRARECQLERTILELRCDSSMRGGDMARLYGACANDAHFVVTLEGRPKRVGPRCAGDC